MVVETGGIGEMKPEGPTETLAGERRDESEPWPLYPAPRPSTRRPSTARATPPRIIVAARTSRVEISSERKPIPPRAASTGTASCTVAARVAVSPRSAAYHTTYPTPDARAPEA